MRVSLRYHGIVGDLVKPKVDSFELNDGSTVGDLFDSLFQQSEKNAAILRQTHAFLNGLLADRSTPLEDGMTVTFMRPIAGG